MLKDAETGHVVPVQGPAVVTRAQYLQMVGRAGRAGLCTSGEAFLIGEGEAHSLTGDWQPVCGLLTADLPQISSQLMPCLLGTHGQASPPAFHTKAHACSTQPSNHPTSSTSAQPTLPSSGLHAPEPCPAAGAPSGTVPEKAHALMTDAPGPGTAEDPEAARAASGVHAERDCRHLQQLLLEAVAVGLVQTSHDIQHLLECTLVFTEAPYATIHATTMRALFKLSK